MKKKTRGKKSHKTRPLTYRVRHNLLLFNKIIAAFCPHDTIFHNLILLRTKGIGMVFQTKTKELTPFIFGEINIIIDILQPDATKLRKGCKFLIYWPKECTYVEVSNRPPIFVFFLKQT